MSVGAPVIPPPVAVAVPVIEMTPALVATEPVAEIETFDAEAEEAELSAEAVLLTDEVTLFVVAAVGAWLVTLETAAGAFELELSAAVATEENKESAAKVERNTVARVESRESLMMSNICKFKRGVVKSVRWSQVCRWMPVCCFETRAFQCRTGRTNV